MGFPSHLVATEYTLPIRNLTQIARYAQWLFFEKAALASILAYRYILSFILARRYAGVGFVFVKFLPVIRVLEIKSRVFGMRDEVRCGRIPFLDSRVGRAFLELNLGWIYRIRLGEYAPPLGRGEGRRLPRSPANLVIVPAFGCLFDVRLATEQFTGFFECQFLHAPISPFRRVAIRKATRCG